jgi:hypothetical protein
VSVKTPLSQALTSGKAERVCAALGRAVLTFIGRVIPRLPAEFSVEDLWLRGLTLSYRTEFRAERPEKMAALFRSAPDHYVRITDAALPVLPIPVEIVEGGDGRFYRARVSAATRLACRLAWKIRSLQSRGPTRAAAVQGAFHIHRRWTTRFCIGKSAAQRRSRCLLISETPPKFCAVSCAVVAVPPRRPLMACTGGLVSALPALKIGDQIAPLPIIQGGMSVGISLAGLASAVAREGGIGVIGTAGIGMLDFDPSTGFVEKNNRALRNEIRKA